VQEIILQTDMLGYPLKIILGFLAFLMIIQNIGTQLCVNLKTHHHDMNNLKLDYSIFFHLNLFEINVICKKQPHKSPKYVFPFFGTQIVNKPSATTKMNNYNKDGVCRM
jgi:hypothetical protein